MASTKMETASDGVFITDFIINKPLTKSNVKRSGLTSLFLNITKWFFGVFVSSIILSILIFIVINFYIFSSIVNLENFFFGFLLLTLLTDGIYILIHLFRKPVKHAQLKCDPKKLTILIACHNGESTIQETIRQAKVHVPANQIIVVSDASTDKTVSLAQMMGVKVVKSTKNIQKAFSVSLGMKFVKTPYVLLLDDDTFIGKTTIPTNLLDEGYSAVSFNVMPTPKKTLLSELQQFEYRKSMQLGRSYRGSTGAIGNVSGAIGLFHSADLVHQVTRHSGQFAGEDEQRTLLLHLMSEGKGITFTDSAVYTEAPDSYLSLYRQRAYKWSSAMPELFSLYWKILLQPRHHYLLKTEKAYQLYYFFTDPLRLLLIFTLLTRTSHLFILYLFYLAINIPVWVRLKFRATPRAVLIFPFYSLFLIGCRFIGYIYWFYTKIIYFMKKFHRYVQHRRLMPEYALVTVVILAMWAFATVHFVADFNLFNKIHNHSLNNPVATFNYNNSTPYITAIDQNQSVLASTTDTLRVPIDNGDSSRAIAYKAIIQYLIQQNNVSALQTEHEKAYTNLEHFIPPFNVAQAGTTIPVPISEIQTALQYEANNK